MQAQPTICVLGVDIVWDAKKLVGLTKLYRPAASPLLQARLKLRPSCLSL